MFLNVCWRNSISVFRVFLRLRYKYLPKRLSSFYWNRLRNDDTEEYYTVKYYLIIDEFYCSVLFIEKYKIWMRQKLDSSSNKFTTLNLRLLYVNSTKWSTQINRSKREAANRAAKSSKLRQFFCLFSLITKKQLNYRVEVLS